MQDARWQAELLETKNELQRLKKRMSLGTPTVHKDLSLISVVPKWSGSDSTITLDEFFTSIESSAKIGNWQENDQLEIAVLRLTSAAKFIRGAPNSMKQECHGRSLKTRLEVGSKMSVRTNTTSPACKRQGRLRTKASKSLQIGVGRWPRRLW
jgi:hypothetical protein